MGAYSRIVIIHGYAGSSAIHWQTWLAKKCRTLGLETFYPKLPHKYNPKLAEWMELLEKDVPSVTEQTVLIGHSLGCQAILQLLKRKNIKSVGLVILVAPPSPSKLVKNGLPFLLTFYNKLDLNAVVRKVNRIEVFTSDNDIWVDSRDAKKLAKELRAGFHIVPGGGHLNVASGFTKFPEILNLIQMGY